MKDFYSFKDFYRFYGNEIKEVFLGILFALFIIFITAGLSYIEFRTDLERIERIRYDLTRVHKDGTEKLIGRASEMNEHIAIKKLNNSRPIIQLFVWNGWDDVEYLDVSLEN